MTTSYKAIERIYWSGEAQDEAIAKFADGKVVECVPYFNRDENFTAIFEGKQNLDNNCLIHVLSHDEYVCKKEKFESTTENERIKLMQAYLEETAFRERRKAEKDVLKG